MLVAGGTDLSPNMKRRQQTPTTLIGLRGIRATLKASRGTRPTGISIGAGVTLTELVQRRPHSRVAAPRCGRRRRRSRRRTLRNMGTLGGNLCLDTRCNYYDQNYEWRKSIDFCMKKDGEICWVATGSPKCLAVSSTDTAPALLALGATVTLVSADGEPRHRGVAISISNDGIHYLTRRPDEILTAIRHPAACDGWRSVYWKLRRRGAVRLPGPLGRGRREDWRRDGVVESARIILGAVASRPVDASAAATALIGQRANG